MVSTIRGAELAIVDALIEKAKKGNHQIAKFLFDHAGLSHQPTAEENDPSLVEVLMERLGLKEEWQQEREHEVTSVTAPQI